MSETFENWDIDGMPIEFALGDDICNIGHEDERWKSSELPNVLVSNHGRFFDTINGRFIKPTHGDREGHKAIKITKNGKHIQKYAHRLIAKAFVPNPKNLPEVRHLDDQAENNEIENLAWGSRTDNMRDCISNGNFHFITKKEREKGLDPMRKPVKAVRMSDGKELYFRSVNDAARRTGAQQANVSKVLYGKRTNTVGHTYEFITKEEYNEKIH